MELTKDSFIGTTIASKYTIRKRLGEGSFGTIYSAVAGKKQFALKIEKKRQSSNSYTNSPIKHHSLIVTEANLMRSLKGCGIPKIYELIKEDTRNIMIMELLGKSLEVLLHLVPNKKMSIKTVSMVGYNMISILQSVHSQNVIHRDIKPDNITIGYNKLKNKLFLIDFGLAKYYRDPLTKVHNEMLMRKKLTGTARYASLNALQGTEQSRRDDLDSLGYVLIYLLKGTLPWQTINTKNKDEKYMKITQKKKSITPSELCKNEPIEFETFINYTNKLLYDEEPDYDYLKSLFTQCLSRHNYTYDNCYDWNDIENSISSNSHSSDVNIISRSKSKENIDEGLKRNKGNDNGDNNCNCNVINEKHSPNQDYVRQETHKTYINNYFISQSSIKENNNNIINNHNAGEDTSYYNHKTITDNKNKAYKSSSITQMPRGKSSSKGLSSKSMSQVSPKCLSQCCILF